MLCLSIVFLTLTGQGAQFFFLSCEVEYFWCFFYFDFMIQEVVVYDSFIKDREGCWSGGLMICWLAAVKLRLAITKVSKWACVDSPSFRVIYWICFGLFRLLHFSLKWFLVNFLLHFVKVKLFSSFELCVYILEAFSLMMVVFLVRHLYKFFFFLHILHQSISLCGVYFLVFKLLTKSYAFSANFEHISFSLCDLLTCLYLFGLLYLFFTEKKIKKFQQTVFAN